MEVEWDSCLICTSQCHSSRKLTTGSNGAVKRERVDNEDIQIQYITADQDDDHPDSASDEEHLTPYFVLRDILKVPTETLEQFNYGEYNSQDPLSQGNNGGQVPLCAPCAELARQFHETFEQVSRLQMILSGIQEEFMDKIQQNKDVQCQGSNSIWNQIRRQVVLQSFGSEPEQTEATDNLEEEWEFGETMVKTEMVDEPDDVEGNFAISASPMSSSALSFDPPLHVEDDEGMPSKKRKTSGPQAVTVFKKKGRWTKATQKCAQCPNCPYRTKESDRKRMATHLLLHEKGSQGVPCPDCGWYLALGKLASHRAINHSLPRTIRKKIKKTPQTPPALQCTFCPHKTTCSSTYKQHQKVHELGSEATPCNGCGIFVLPNSFIAHQKVCARVIRNSLGRDKLLVGSEGKMRNINSSNPAFIFFNRALQKRKIYQCRQCSYETLTPVRMKVHVELHDEGSTAATCAECGWFLPPDQLETHQAFNHSAEELPAGVDLEDHPIPQPRIKKIPPVFRCPHCPHESKTKGYYEAHLALHSEDSNAIPCPDCQVFYRPIPIASHQNCSKWKRLYKNRLLMSALENDRKLEENPSGPHNPD